MSVEARIWRAGDKAIALDRPIVIGIVNVTPDSFSDGGLAFSPEAAVAQGLRQVELGADVIDVGGESTRPGAQAISADEELGRVIPVVDQLRARAADIPLSVDTVKAAVARTALETGADIVNDVSGLRLDPQMATECARFGCGVILMHSRGAVADMAGYSRAVYGDDVTGEVCGELARRVRAAEAAGILSDRIVLDPGIGFSKRTEHSVTLLRELPRVIDLGYPVLVGVSRKRVMGELSGVTAAAERDAASTGAHVYALLRGARLFRVHDVRAARQSLDVAWALMTEHERAGTSAELT